MAQCTQLNVRAEPGAGSKIVSTLDCDHDVTVLDRKILGQSSWLKIRFLAVDGRELEGWVNGKYLEVTALEEFLKTLEAINRGGAKPGCSPQSTPGSERGAVEIRGTQVLGQAPIDSSSSANLASDRRLGRGTYKTLRDSVKNLSGKECHAKLNELYKAELGVPPQKALWAEFTEKQRAERVYAHARRTGELLASSKAGLSGVVTPELVACIAFQETRGNLTPHRVNYTFCAPEGRGKYLSSAHGLGQMTRSTLKGMWEEGKLRLSTVQGYEKSSANEVFEALNDDVPLQMEILYRTLSEKARIANNDLKNDLASARPKEAQTESAQVQASQADTSLLSETIFRYDTDRADSYVTHVREICLPCMKALAQTKETPSDCLEKMK